MQCGAFEVCKLLLAHKTNVKLERDDGYAFVYVVALKGLRNMVELMMKQGADLSVNPKDGPTPLIIAAAYGTCKCVGMFYQY